MLPASAAARASRANGAGAAGAKHQPATKFAAGGHVEVVSYEAFLSAEALAVLSAPTAAERIVRTIALPAHGVFQAVVDGERSGGDLRRFNAPLSALAGEPDLQAAAADVVRAACAALAAAGVTTDLTLCAPRPLLGSLPGASAQVR